MGFIQLKNFVNKNGEQYTIRTVLPEDAQKVLRFNKTIISEAPFLLTTEVEIDFIKNEKIDNKTIVY